MQRYDAQKIHGRRIHALCALCSALLIASSAWSLSAQTSAPGATDDAKPDSAGGAPADDPDDASSRHAAGGMIPPAPAGKGRVRNLEVEAQQCKEAGEALQLYKLFLADAKTTAEEKDQARQRMGFWEQAARDDLVRVGKKWYTKA